MASLDAKVEQLGASGSVGGLGLKDLLSQQRGYLNTLRSRAATLQTKVDNAEMRGLIGTREEADVTRARQELALIEKQFLNAAIPLGRAMHVDVSALIEMQKLGVPTTPGTTGGGTAGGTTDAPAAVPQELLPMFQMMPEEQQKAMQLKLTNPEINAHARALFQKFGPEKGPRAVMNYLKLAATPETPDEQVGITQTEVE
jgi:hypothetical protein